MRTAFALWLGLVTLSGCGGALPGVLSAANRAPVQALAQDAPDPVGPMPARFVEVTNKHHDLLFRGGVPNDDHLKVLLETGVISKQSPKAPVQIKTIINLLTPSQDAASIQHEADVALAHGVKFVNIPLPWQTVAPTPMIETWFREVALARAAHTGIYIHCTHGRDRTGSMVAIYREQFDGWTPKKALAEMEAPFFGFDPLPFPWITSLVTNFKPLKLD
jgi:hypothetical protein